MASNALYEAGEELKLDTKSEAWVSLPVSDRAKCRTLKGLGTGCTVLTLRLTVLPSICHTQMDIVGLMPGPAPLPLKLTQVPRASCLQNSSMTHGQQSLG